MDDLSEALKDPKFREWWNAKEKYVEEHYTENPTLDTYMVTLSVKVQFARENDGVLSPQDVLNWFRAGSIDLLAEEHEILTVEKVE